MTGSQLRAAREAGGWTVAALAAAARTSESTLRRLEAGEPGRPSTWRRIEAALAGVPERGDGAEDGMLLLVRAYDRGDREQRRLLVGLARQVLSFTPASEAAAGAAC